MLAIVVKRGRAMLIGACLNGFVFCFLYGGRWAFYTFFSEKMFFSSWKIEDFSSSICSFIFCIFSLLRLLLDGTPYFWLWLRAAIKI
jgi:hypothetical protein